MKRNKLYLVAFGKNLKALMDAKGLIADDIAAHARIEPKAVYRIINGEHSTGIAIVYSIAKALGVEPKVLFDFEFKDSDS